MLDTTNFSLNSQIIAGEVTGTLDSGNRVDLQKMNTAATNAVTNQVVNPKVLGYNIMWEKQQQRSFEQEELTSIFSTVALEMYIGNLSKSDYCRHLGEYFQRTINGAKYEYKWLQEKQLQKDGTVKNVNTNTCIFVIHKLNIEDEKKTKLEVFCKLSLTFDEETVPSDNGGDSKVYYPLHLEVLEGQQINCKELLEEISKYDSEDLMQILRDICNSYGYKYNTHAGVYFLPVNTSKLLIAIADELLDKGLELRYLTVVGATQDDYRFLSKIFASDIIEELENAQIELVGYYLYEHGKSEKLAQIMKHITENNFDSYLDENASQNPLLALITNRVKALRFLSNSQRLGDKQLQRMVKKILQPAQIRRVETLREKISSSLQKLQDSLPEELLERVEMFIHSRKTAYEHVNELVSTHIQTKLLEKISKHK